SHEPCARRAAILAAGSAGILAWRTIGRQGCRPNWQAGSLPYVPSQVHGHDARPMLEVEAHHEPPRSRPSATLSPRCGERAEKGVPFRLKKSVLRQGGTNGVLVPMRPIRRVEKRFADIAIARTLTDVKTAFALAACALLCVIRR